MVSVTAKIQIFEIDSRPSNQKAVQFFPKAALAVQLKAVDNARPKCTFWSGIRKRFFFVPQRRL